MVASSSGPGEPFATKIERGRSAASSRSGMRAAMHRPFSSRTTVTTCKRRFFSLAVTVTTDAIATSEATDAIGAAPFRMVAM